MGNGTISVVDDDPFAREGIGGLIQSFGYDVYTFSSGEHFLTSAAVNETECLITDLQMPGLSGLDLQRELHDRGRNIPVIFITAYFDEQRKTQALAAGAVGFLGKPFEERCLLDCLARILGPRDRGLP